MFGVESLGDLRDLTGIPKTWLSRFLDKNNQHKRLQTYCKLASALDISMDQLCNGVLYKTLDERKSFIDQCGKKVGKSEAEIYRHIKPTTTTGGATIFTFVRSGVYTFESLPNYDTICSFMDCSLEDLLNRLLTNQDFTPALKHGTVLKSNQSDSFGNLISFSTSRKAA